MHTGEFNTKKEENILKQIRKEITRRVKNLSSDRSTLNKQYKSLMESKIARSETLYLCQILGELTRLNSERRFLKSLLAQIDNQKESKN